MSRLYRPHVPLKTRCRVALRQLGEMWADDFLAEYEADGGAWGPLLAQLLARLAQLLGEEKLHLDHDPALATRKRRGEGKRTVYTPDANSVDHLIYRGVIAHRLKTNVKGDGAQYPDRVLIKRERKRRQSLVSKPTCRAKKSTWPKRQWPKRSMR